MGMFDLIKLLSANQVEFVLVGGLAVGTDRIPLASIDHLIAMKSATGRSKDAIDIEELRRIKSRKDSGTS